MSERLRTFLQADHSRNDKALALLAVSGRPSSVSDLSALASENGARVTSAWNLSESLKRTRGKAIRTTAGWELTDAGRDRVAAWGFGAKTLMVVTTLASLRDEVNRLSSEDDIRFLTEGIECVEHGYHRAAVVMSWVAAVYALQAHVLQNYIAEFNLEALRRDSKWRAAKSLDGLARAKESDFLDILVSIGVIGKNVKDELKSCLERRNACGHPNSYHLKELTVAHHIETLVSNVFSKF